MNPYNIQNTNICNGIFHILFFKAQEEIEDTKGVIRICLSKKIRKHNCQNRKYKRANTDLQNIHIKLKIEKHVKIKYP
jgi:hypothetical protein